MVTEKLVSWLFVVSISVVAVVNAAEEGVAVSDSVVAFATVIVTSVSGKFCVVETICVTGANVCAVVVLGHSVDGAEVP